MNLNQETLQTYDFIAKQYGDTRMFDFWKDEIAQYLRYIPGKTIIDIGCGTGRDIEPFHEAGVVYTGIDASKGMLTVATQRHPEAKLLLMDFYQLSFPQKSFDGFWAVASLIHIPKWRIQKVLRNIKCIVRDDGVGFLAMKEKEDSDTLYTPDSRYDGRRRFFALYTLEEFAEVLDASGWLVMKSFRVQREGKWLCYYVKKK